MRLRRANLVITAVAAFAGAGLMAGRVLTSQPEPLDLGPVVIVERSGGSVPGTGEPLPPATSRPPRTGTGESGPPPSRKPRPVPSPAASTGSPSHLAPPYASPPQRTSPPPRNPGGRPVPPLPPPRSDDGSGRPMPTAEVGDDGEEGDGDGDADRGGGPSGDDEDGAD
ncbi:hypothetical protein [Streptomyces tsukubensis]|uniref:hypothetical protein n=1 Tax=Streptomyces tsukubensis TaxID=83656 RepID=UPI00344FF80E